MFEARNLKGGIQSLFDPFVNTVRRRRGGHIAHHVWRGVITCIPLHFLLSYRGAAGAHHRYHVIHRVISYMLRVHVGKLSSSRLTKLFGGLSYKKIHG